MLKFKHFMALLEGGNIKVKTPDGEVQAAPFQVKNRPEQSSHIRSALEDLHDQFHKEHGEHLFGKNKSGLKSGSVFAGSTKAFMDKSVPDNEVKKYMPSVGDTDVQISHDHKKKLGSFLTPGRKLGPYTVVGTKAHGNEISAVMKHQNGEHHQFDFEGVKTDEKTGEPTAGEQFLHSANWQDRKAGIKGLHHKILLNAAGLDHHKFSITHGLRSRTDENDKGTNEPEGISKTLFGDKADHSQIHSFHGVTQLIKKHVPADQHQAIYDKFKSSLERVKADHGPALAHLRQHLNVKDTMAEETQENEGHVTAIPMVGFSPFSHSGHAADLGGALKPLPGPKHIGISSKADVYSPQERKNILDKQWAPLGLNHQTHVVSGAGETIRSAYDSVQHSPRKVLHLVVGADRKGFAEGLKASLEKGAVKEMEGRKFDEIHLHYPQDEGRSHGMSGTKMRQAALDGDIDTFHKHLGSMFSRKEAMEHMTRIQDAIKSGKLKVKR